MSLSVGEMRGYFNLMSTTPPTCFSTIFFQRELSIIDFTLNYPPIRNNLTSASLGSVHN